MLQAHIKEKVWGSSATKLKIHVMFLSKGYEKPLTLSITNYTKNGSRTFS
jgi:hypothetical protein